MLSAGVEVSTNKLFIGLSCSIERGVSDSDDVFHLSQSGTFSSETDVSFVTLIRGSDVTDVVIDESTIGDVVSGFVSHESDPLSQSGISS